MLRMMVLLISAAVFVATGYGIVRRCSSFIRNSGPFERLAAAFTLGIAVWLSSTWSLALTHLLTPGFLFARTVLAACVAVALNLRRPASAAANTGWRQAVLWGPLVPPGLWLLFLLWRGSVIPPLSHDALSYHLPKAVLWLRSSGYRYLEELEPIIRQLPANYEMMLADAIALDGDRHVEWLSAFHAIAMVVMSAALAERWWGKNRAGATSIILLTMAAPIVLLQAGAIKNDLLTAVCMIAVLLWSGRWWRDGDDLALLLLIVAAIAGVGTKPQAAMSAAAVAPFVLYRGWQEWHCGRLGYRRLAGIAVFTVFSFVALGGAVYISNAIHRSAPIGVSLGADPPKTGSPAIMYGDWRNLWEGPWVLLTAPLSPWSDALWVPGYAEPWYWRRYEIYFSHLGIMFTIAALSLPVAIRKYWRRGKGRGSERRAVSIAALIICAGMLPVVFKPHGMYDISLPRYMLFALPLVFSWTAIPLLRIARRNRRVATLIVRALAFFFFVQACEYVLLDRFAPLDYVIWAFRHPGTRLIPFDSSRAESVVDEMAGPHDKVALDIAVTSWIYPVFGRDLTRPVELIPAGEGPPVISEDAKWVAIDRSWNVVWAVPGFSDLSKWSMYLGQGHPTADDLRVFRFLSRDRNFQLVSYDAKRNQAVFKRVRSAR